MRENFHAARWDEPLVMELGAPGRRGAIVAAPGDEAGAALVPESMRRAAPPELPELSEHDVLRHYLHLAQETLGMLGVSLFGTCTSAICGRIVSCSATRGLYFTVQVPNSETPSMPSVSCARCR